MSALWRTGAQEMQGKGIRRRRRAVAAPAKLPRVRFGNPGSSGIFSSGVSSTNQNLGLAEISQLIQHESRMNTGRIQDESRVNPGRVRDSSGPDLGELRLTRRLARARSGGGGGAGAGVRAGDQQPRGGGERAGGVAHGGGGGGGAERRQQQQGRRLAALLQHHHRRLRAPAGCKPPGSVRAYPLFRNSCCPAFLPGIFRLSGHF